MSNDIWENHQRVSGTEEQQNNREEIALRVRAIPSSTTRIEMQKQYDGDQK